MLYFSRWKTTLIWLVILAGVLFAFPNLLTQQQLSQLPDWFPKRQLTLGLDLQGGSHILLEVDREDIEKERLETTVDDMRRLLREEGIGYTGLSGNGRVAQVTIRNPEDVAAARDALSELTQLINAGLMSGGSIQEAVMSEPDPGRIALTLTEEGLNNRVASAASPTASLLIRAQGQASRRVTGPVRVRITGSGPAAAIEITENRPVGQVLLRSNLPISIASDGEDGFNLDDRLFPGSARILAGKDTLSVIALVPTETYVAGVIAVAFPLALLLGGKALDLWPLFGATNQILAGLSLTVNDGGSGFAAGWRRRIAARRTSGWVVTALSGGAPLRRLGFRRIRSPGETNFSTPPRSSISRATDSSTRARS